MEIMTRTLVTSLVPRLIKSPLWYFVRMSIGIFTTELKRSCRTSDSMILPCRKIRILESTLAMPRTMPRASIESAALTNCEDSPGDSFSLASARMFIASSINKGIEVVVIIVIIRQDIPKV